MPTNYVLLRATKLTADTASVTFDSIPQTGYTDLKLVATARSTRSGGVTTDEIRIGFNGLTTNQTTRVLQGAGSGSVVSYTDTRVTMGIAPTASTTSSTFGNAEIIIPNYTSGVVKYSTAESVSENNATAAYQNFWSNLWSSNAAITSITLSLATGPSFATGSTFYLYGLAASDATPTAGPKATGGNIVATDGTYWYHTYLTSGTFIPKASLTCDYLVIAGGGGGAGVYSGGNYSAPGGGAGGYRTSAGTSGGGASAESALSLTAQTYAVAVGAGAPSGNFSGSDSIFGSITSIGGGGTPGKTGGSGGGAFDFSPQNTAGSGTAGQGYAGGLAASATSAGGGGGAGSVGSTARTGGSGVASSITGTSVTRAGGGGAGWGGTATAGGGAGAAANATGSGTAATVNTGGGGGGGAAANGFGAGGAGGSGLVVVRYAV
jgi:hypothetical protein